MYNKDISTDYTRTNYMPIFNNLNFLGLQELDYQQESQTIRLKIR